MAEQRRVHLQGARGTRNTVNTVPPREYICLVGAPTNSFNGWQIRAVREFPDGQRESVTVPKAKPKNMEETVAYVSQAPTVPRGVPDVASLGPGQDRNLWAHAWRDAVSADEWRSHGWSEYALRQLVSKGWSPRDVTFPEKPYTHDRFWGNFIYAARHLYEPSPAITGGGFPPPPPAPGPGDLVTFIVAYIPYAQRDDIDFAASHYNIANRNKLDDSGMLGDPPKRRAPKRPGVRASVPAGDYATLSLAQKAQLLCDEAKKRGKTISVGQATEYLLAEGENDGV